MQNMQNIELHNILNSGVYKNILLNPHLKAQRK